MSEKRKKLPKRIVALIVFGAVVLSLAAAFGFLQLFFVLADKIQCWRPDYELLPLDEILEKPELSADDYDLLYRQTGLTQTGIDRCLSTGSKGKTRIKEIQKDYFGEHEVTNEWYAPLICTDRINGYFTHAYLENGDIVVTSATHISGWRMGHAGLVVNGDSGKILQANAIGETSKFSYITDFTSRVNFMILTVKDEYAESGVKNSVAAYAAAELTGKIYDPTAGIFSNKNKVEKTQCAHIVWYAWKQFGVDLDSNGGPVVTPKNIANSEYLELVQVFGFDPETLWR